MWREQHWACTRNRREMNRFIEILIERTGLVKDYKEEERFQTQTRAGRAPERHCLLFVYRCLPNRFYRSLVFL